MRRVILSADDFGLCASVNEAVEEAHSDGVLSTASLMVGAQGTAEAVERARRLPGLHIGLHLVLVNGRPLSAPCEIPALTGPDGSFSSDLFRSGVRFFFSPAQDDSLERKFDLNSGHSRKQACPSITLIAITTCICTPRSDSSCWRSAENSD